MFEEQRLGNDGTEASRPCKPDDGGNQMKEKEDHIAHPGMVSKPEKTPNFDQFSNSPWTGLRAGELCGLTVDDIAIERGMLQVRQSAWRGKLGDPKTDDSIRVVELSPQACAHLRTFLK